MRLNLLSYVSGLGVIAGALLWSTPSQAQGFCYMVDPDGTVTNLDSLCQGNDTPTPSEPQAETTGAGEVQQSPSPNIRSFTITGPPSVPGSSQDPAVVAPTTPQPTGTDAGLDSTMPQPTETDAGVAPAGAAVDVDIEENATGVATPVREVEVPAIVVPGIPVPGIGAP